MNIDVELHRRIAAAGQLEVLRFWDALDDAGQRKLAAQLAEINWEELPGLIRDYVLQRPQTAIPADLTPAKYFPDCAADSATEALYRRAAAAGEAALRQGRVCCLTVAGGQGTRLGFDGPKGTYPICPVTGKTLFQYFAEEIGRVAEKYGHAIPWYIMTSELNDRATREFFAAHENFGLPQGSVRFFTQGTMPAVGYDGQLLAAGPDSLALSPNGHGGTLLALRKSGALDEMTREGVEYISYFQVDNPLVPLADPLFLGLHCLEKSRMSARMLPKTNAFEKLGNFCLSGGRVHIIEYSDLPDELAERRNPDGGLAFVAGSPAIHVISRDFVEELTAGGRLELPWHRADKKVPYLNEQGESVKPEEPNAVKLESFIFDALPLAEKVLILEGCRAEHFAPTKNRTGVDSAESCRAMMCARDARRLELAGLKVPRKPDGSPDCIVEISPRLVCDDQDAAFRLSPKEYLAPKRGEKVYYD